MNWTNHNVVFAHTLELPELVCSYRVMSMLPAQQIGARFLYMTPDESPAQFLDRAQPAILVLGKPINGDRTPLLAEQAKARGVKVISWYCDLPTSADMRDSLARLAAASDALVVQTGAMAQSIAASLGRRPDIIEECLEYPTHAPHFAPTRTPLQLLWYGNATNFDTLPALFASLARGVGREVTLAILAASRPEAMDGAPFDVQWAPWSRPLQLMMMRSADIVLAPSLDSPAKHLKGHNRVSEAINQGCVTVAYPLAPYRELSDHLFLHEDIGEGVKRALADPEQALAKVRTGQIVVLERFSAPAIGRKWSALIDRVAQI